MWQTSQLDMLTLAHPEIVQDPAAGNSTACEPKPAPAADHIRGAKLGTEEHDETSSLCKVPAVSVDEDDPILQQQHVNGHQGPSNKAEPRHSGSAQALAQKANQTEQRHTGLCEASLAAA